ncbi:zinc finger CCCH domain-containing protein 48-like [Amaranthus tricolor]|uniref:zinc finger CCCH domain-containing protein 48-like n=1 Tax=Amaranthus tricolor TaxID=29722 RepID=UPI00258F0A68|nr:zinc finger CCCH domain-containing protein 48-like [Amaranthus tricolor]XP_057533321.1 zinc finger CCCH domain-containing protein 48-like [Amaranthus tricolor]
MPQIVPRVSKMQSGRSLSWGRQSANVPICKFWLAGDCRRNPCRFAHPKIAAPVTSALRSSQMRFKQSHIRQSQMKVNMKEVKNKAIDNCAKSRAIRLNRYVLKRSDTLQRQLKADIKVEHEDGIELKRKKKEPSENKIKENENGNELKRMRKVPSENKVEECVPVEKRNNVSSSDVCNLVSENIQMSKGIKVCEQWVKKSCDFGEQQFLHSWSYGDGFSMLAQLEGHSEAVTGITLPSGSDKLFSGSKDGTVRVWNCHSGECIAVANMGAPVECLISEGSWVFMGLTNAVKVLNIETNAEFILSAPGGQVYTMAVANGLLLVGVHDGSILACKFNHETSSFDVVATLKGHTGAVTSLIGGVKFKNMLCSGSADKTIRVWDLDTMQCTHLLDKHSEVVMSLRFWEEYLFSGSLDKTLKIWASTEAGVVDVTYERNEEHGNLSMCVMHDSTNKPMLLSSCDDNTV